MFFLMFRVDYLSQDNKSFPWLLAFGENESLRDSHSLSFNKTFTISPSRSDLSKNQDL